jgi:hypothetical protein
VSEVINLLADAEIIMQLNGELRADFEDAARADNGREVVYGAKTKGKQHITVESMANDKRYQQQTISFDEHDIDIAEEEASNG